MKSANKSTNHQKSIRKKILLWMSLTVFIALLVTCAVSSGMNYRGTISLLRQTMSATAVVAAERVGQELTAYGNIAQEVGCMPQLSDASASVQEKKELIAQRASAHGFKRGDLLEPDGSSVFDGANYYSQDYFKKALQGQVVVSEPSVNAATGELSIIIAAPVWKNGVYGSVVSGVVYFVPDPSFLNNIVTSIHVSDNGSAYIISASGTTIAHKNMGSVKNQENTMNDAKSDPALADLAAMEQAMTQGKSGFGVYSYGGVRKLLAYAPIAASNGWSIGINCPLGDFMNQTMMTVIVSVGIAILAIFVAIAVANHLSSGIGKPLHACAERLETLAEGDLHSPMPQVKDTQDEVSMLLHASTRLQKELRDIIMDIGYVMAEMSKGNFVVKSRNEDFYVGDYKDILLSMRSLRNNMAATLRQISSAANQVDSGANQLAAGSQTLSHGTMEQSSSTEELVNTIVEINQLIQETCQFAEEAREKTDQAGASTSKCTDQMDEMLAAMAEIDRSSQEISKIIKAIEDIAFQTNILALNAAVEAARAGDVGKGFAVVADEVRSLAGKSAEASKNTAALIEASVTAVRKGVDLAHGTARQMTDVAEDTQEIIDIVTKIDSRTRQQILSMDQISSSVNQISGVVQNNAITAQESASTSQELSSQADMMRDLVKRFQLNEA